MDEQAVRGYFLLQMSANRGGRLTVEFIKRVHGILMSGAMENCGELRTHEAYADGYVFAPADSIEHRIQNMVDSFEEGVASGESYVVKVAVQLMLDFVTIHPFSNGNGRMCRLLFSYLCVAKNGISVSRDARLRSLEIVQTLYHCFEEGTDTKQDWFSVAACSGLYQYGFDQLCNV
jgi:fido (protein-threonine AMPylation protein)